MDLTLILNNIIKDVTHKMISYVIRDKKVKKNKVIDEKEKLEIEKRYIDLIICICQQLKEEIHCKIFQKNSLVNDENVTKKMIALYSNYRNDSTIPVGELQDVIKLFLRSYWVGIIYGKNLKIHFSSNYKIYVDIYNDVKINKAILNNFSVDVLNLTSNIKNYFRKLGKNDTIYFSYNTGICKYMNDGKEKAFKTVFSIYNSQYPPIINKEKQQAIIVSYEKGLYCYNYETGKLVWRLKIKKIHDNYFYENKIICLIEDKGIAVIDASNGEVLQNIESSGNILFKISSDEIIYDRDENLIIYDLKLNREKYIIPVNKINTSNSRSFIIKNCVRKKDYLIFDGLEYSKYFSFRKKLHKFYRKIRINNFNYKKN